MREKGPNPIDAQVGSRVRMRRLILDLSQEKLGDALGVTFQKVQKYEKGTNRISASRLQQIANFLNVPVSFFFEATPRPSKAGSDTGTPPHVLAFITSREGLSLTRSYMKLKSPALRRAIVQLVEEIAGND